MKIVRDWKNRRWEGIRRAYSTKDVAGFHALNDSMFELARQYRDDGMTAYSRMQESEFAAEAKGYTATKHQREVGTGYFDEIAKVISAGESSTIALEDSTETAQFS